MTTFGHIPIIPFIGSYRELVKGRACELLFANSGTYSAPNRALPDSVQRRLFASRFPTMSLSWFQV